MAFIQNSDGFPNLTVKGTPTLLDIVYLADAAASNQPKQATFGSLPLVQRAGDTMTGPLILPADPLVPLSAATKQYVDATATGLNIQGACSAATTADLNATYANGAAGIGATLVNAGALAAFSVDGVSPALNSRILVKDQTNDFENGIYTVTTVGSGAVAWVLTRATDYDQVAEINPGDLVVIQTGTVNAVTSWLQTETVATIGVDAILFVQFTAGVGANVTLSNLTSPTAINQDLLPGADNTLNLGSDAARWADLYAVDILTGQSPGDVTTISVYDTNLVGYVPVLTLTANNTPTAVLGSLVTATTQVPGTNDTTIATTAYADAIAALKANVSLNNLAGVAINTSLVSDTDVTDNLGSQASRWNNIYAATLQTGDTAADTLEIGAWDVNGAVFVPFFTLTANNTPTGVLASDVTGTTQAPGTNTTQLATTAFVFAATGGGGGANVMLSNLSAVAINTTLVSDTDITDDLGTQAIRWNNIYAATLQTGDTAADTLQICAWDVDNALFVPFFTLTANNTPTGVLSGSVTGTTQAGGTNNTTLATTAFVTAAVAAVSGGANTALSNLAAVAINTTLVSDTDATDDLGSGTVRWANTYTQTVRTGTGAANTLLLQARDVDGAVWTTFATLTANDTPTMALSGDVTSVTQSANNNSTKIATTAYVDAAIGPTSAGSYILLAEVSSASTASANFDNLMTATYDHYFFTISRVYPATNNVIYGCRVGTGAGPTYEATNYDGDVLDLGAGSGGNVTRFPLTRTNMRNTTPTKVGNGYAYIHNTNDATNFKGISGAFSYHETGDTFMATVFGGTWAGATVLTSAQFFASSGNHACLIRMYGVRNS